MVYNRLELYNKLDVIINLEALYKFVISFDCWNIIDDRNIININQRIILEKIDIYFNAIDGGQDYIDELNLDCKDDEYREIYDILMDLHCYFQLAYDDDLDWEEQYSNFVSLKENLDSFKWAIENAIEIIVLKGGF